MNHFITQLKGLGFALCLSSTCLFSATVQAALAAETMLDFANSPIVSADSATPMVMIAASNDHQLYFKAYSDYSDLDHDGIIETSYKHSFDYYGYFDSDKCYSHSGSQFVPEAVRSGVGLPKQIVISDTETAPGNEVTDNVVMITLSQVLTTGKVSE